MPAKRFLPIALTCGLLLPACSAAGSASGTTAMVVGLAIVLTLAVIGFVTSRIHLAGRRRRELEDDDSRPSTEP